MATPSGHAGCQKFDVLGLGCAAVDDFIYVPAFPVADRKVRVARSSRQCGGLTGAALVAAARSGARAAYAGCLGEDEYSVRIARHFAQEGVDTTHAPRLREATTVHSTIVVATDTGTRNVFYEAAGRIGAHETLPEDDVLRSTHVLFIDTYGMAGNLRAARVARAAGVAVVADFEEDEVPLFREVLALVDHLIVAEDFALRMTGASDAADAARQLWGDQRCVVIVTCGAQGCWSVSSTDKGSSRHHPAFKVKAADTTGCGDVFHGAYAASLATGGTLETNIRHAAAAAALKALTSETPHRRAIDEFLRTHRDA